MRGESAMTKGKVGFYYYYYYWYFSNVIIADFDVLVISQFLVNFLLAI